VFDLLELGDNLVELHIEDGLRVVDTVHIEEVGDSKVADIAVVDIQVELLVVVLLVVVLAVVDSSNVEVELRHLDHSVEEEH
jgi:hypothetical protein